MLSCKDFLKELGDFLEDCCDPKLKEELHTHLKNCPNCWVVADTTKKTVEVYHGQNQEPRPVPEGVRSKLMAALHRKMAERRGAGN